jgi:23S rRNA (uracil1939-C5)-methyltransferase
MSEDNRNKSYNRSGSNGDRNRKDSSASGHRGGSGFSRDNKAKDSGFKKFDKDKNGTGSGRSYGGGQGAKSGSTYGGGQGAKSGRYNDDRRSEKPVRSYEGDRSERPARSFEGERGDKTARSYDGDRSTKPGRSYGGGYGAKSGSNYGGGQGAKSGRSYDDRRSDKPARSYDDRRSDKPERSYDDRRSDKPARSYDNERSEKPVRSYDGERGAKPERNYSGGFGKKTGRSYEGGQGAKSGRSYDDRRSDKPARSFDNDRSDKPSRSYEGDRGAKPERNYNGGFDKKPGRSYEGGQGTKSGRSFDDRRSDKPVRSYDNDRNEKPSRSYEGDRSAKPERNYSTGFDKKTSRSDGNGYGARSGSNYGGGQGAKSGKSFDDRRSGKPARSYESDQSEIPVKRYGVYRDDKPVQNYDSERAEKPAKSYNGERKAKPGRNDGGVYGAMAGRFNDDNGISKKKTINNDGCTYIRGCGGCDYGEESYESELKAKQKKVEALLKDYCKVQPIIGMKKPEHYRNKVHVVFDHDRKGNPISGVYETGTHRVIPIESCHIHNQKADEIIASIRGMLKSFKIKTYDEDSGYGLMRHVLIKTGFSSGEIMVVLVLSSPILPSKNNFIKALLKEHPEISTIVINVNDKKTSMVLGDKEQVIYGKGYIEDKLCGKTFRISPKSFYQVNPEQTEVLYAKAIEMAGLTGEETVIDAYCGIGTIGIVAADHAKSVIGVELNKDAVKDANVNAKLNETKNIEFYKNDAGDFMTQMAEQKATADVVFMDPPRTGSNEKFMDALALLKPKKVVYISCNPITLERDLKYLKMKGYKAEKAVPVDMFPWTEHVETVVLMSRVEK